MGRERFKGIEARIPARITSALAIQRERSEQRRLERAQGHFANSMEAGAYPEGRDQEIVLMVQPGFRECADTSVFNQSVTRQWREDPNPREDAWEPRP